MHRAQEGGCGGEPGAAAAADVLVIRILASASLAAMRSASARYDSRRFGGACAGRQSAQTVEVGTTTFLPFTLRYLRRGFTSRPQAGQT
jgi:hypothetical protein